jgi:hypothetical protein
MTEGQTATQRIVAMAQSAKAWMDSPAGKRVQKLCSMALSALILLILARAILDVGWDEIVAVLPTTPLFWLLFLASYFLQPIVDWVIYWRWWPMIWRDMSVMLKKRVMNEALFSYSGETFLLVWATKKLGIEFDPDAPPKRIMGRGDGPGLDPRDSPFAAVKDVAITSGLAGNLTTLLLLILALSMGGDDVLADSVDPSVIRTIILSFGALIVLNIGILAFRSRVMSIPVRENVQLFWLHLGRVLGQHVLITLSWIVALPAVDIHTWILLGALRMVIGRLPLPNKELLFAAVAVSLTGDASIQVAALLAAQGALHLVLHGVAWVAGSAIEDRETLA